MVLKSPCKPCLLTIARSKELHTLKVPPQIHILIRITRITRIRATPTPLLRMLILLMLLILLVLLVLLPLLSLPLNRIRANRARNRSSHRTQHSASKLTRKEATRRASDQCGTETLLTRLSAAWVGL